MNSAIPLIIFLLMTLMLGMPIIGWIVSRKRDDKFVQFWFLAIIFDGLQIPIVAARTSYPGWFTFVVPSIIAVIFYLTIWQLIRIEINRIFNNKKFWRSLWFSVVFNGLSATIVFYFYQNSPIYIYTFCNLVYLGLATVVGLQALLLGAKEHSKSIYFVAIGFFLGAIGFIIRAYWHLVLQTSIPVFEFSVASNFVVILQTLNLLLMTFGYLGFVRDKAENEKILLTTQVVDALARREEAEKYAQELLKTIEERDSMVLVNSRFLNLSALAIFNTAIIHEVSQPLLAATMSLESLQLRDKDYGGALADDIYESISLVNKVSDIIHSLRRMMVMDSGVLEKVDILAQLNSIVPIIKAGCRTRGIQFNCYFPHVAAIRCECNSILFQRLIINLVTNAFDSFESGKTSHPELTISVDYKLIDNQQKVIIAIQDNGPGMSDEELKALFKPFNTNKQNGIGIGLSLASILLRKWRGQIQADHINNGSGIIFKIILPVCADSDN